MLDSITQMLTSAATSEAVTNAEVVMSMVVALVLGFVISICYLITNKEAMNRKSLAITLIMLPVILAVIILFVGSNVARAFSLAGTMSIIRFRSSAGEPKDIGYIFFATAAGLACGVGFYSGAAIFVLMLSIVMILIDKMHYAGQPGTQKLKITIPEDLNYKEAFEDVFSKYTAKHLLKKVKTTELGSLFELHYSVQLKRSATEKEFIDELRCCNGNLSIMLTMEATE